MSLLTEFLEALRRDPPKPPPVDPETRLEGERIRAAKKTKDERDCFRRELLRLGYSPLRLETMANLYRRSLVSEVRRVS